MLKLSAPSIGEAELAAVAAVLRSGNLVYGERGRHFEERLATYLGVRECVVVSSGTAALHLALLALDIGAGDAVLVPDYTFPATANAVSLTGATPVFVDVDEARYCMDVAELRRTCEAWAGPERLRAVMPVHEFGAPAEIEAIAAVAAAHGLVVVEDAACAFGTRTALGLAGTVGQAGCFSFHPRKIITTGEGGAVATDDADLAERVRVLRNHGIRRDGTGVDFVARGLNYRLSDIQSALGIAQLATYDERVASRRRLKDVYLAELQGLDDLRLPAVVDGHVWQTFLVWLSERVPRDGLMEYLRAQGVETSVGAQCVRRQSAYRAAPDPAGRRWRSEVLGAQGLALPLCETYGEDDLRWVAARVRDGLRACRGA